MRFLRLGAVLVLALVLSACSGGVGTWTFSPTQPPSPGTQAGGSAAPGGGAPSASSSTGAAGASPSASSGAGAVNLSLTARNIKFDASSLTAPANTPFTISLTNDDNGVPHNVSIQSASGQSILAGDSITTGTKSYSVKALPPGTYKFFCSVHPTLMYGTLTVK